MELESRAEIAEDERDVALSKLRVCTPRPPLNLGHLPSILDPADLKNFQEALSKFRCLSLVCSGIKKIMVRAHDLIHCRNLSACMPVCTLQ